MNPVSDFQTSVRAPLVAVALAILSACSAPAAEARQPTSVQPSLAAPSSATPAPGRVGEGKSTIEGPLAERLARTVSGQVPIVIEFSTWPADDELRGLGLVRAGAVARGFLSPERIRGLAQFSQVTRIALDEHAALPAVTPESKFGGSLVHRLLEEPAPQTRHPVIVIFAEAPFPPPAIDGLSVENGAGWGALTRDRIQQLALRRDVTGIDLMPRMTPRVGG